ncbi:MAG: hypothetical protein IPN19_11355 [Elusimicrobia bacterium]|nr:hypothetical protein [Elusimicrobiota bacterium]
MDKMSGSSLYNYILRTFKRTDKETEVYEAITDTLVDMCERFGFEDTKVEAYTTSGITALGDYKIDLPDDFGRLLGDVRWSDQDDSYVLQRLSKREFHEMFPDPYGDDPIDGEPTHYCVFGKQILLGPVPDDVTYEYQIDYSTFPAGEITSTSSDVLFTDVARECIRYGTLYRLFEQMEKFDLSGYHKQKYEEELGQFVSRETGNIRSMFSMRQVDF